MYLHTMYCIGASRNRCSILWLMPTYPSVPRHLPKYLGLYVYSREVLARFEGHSPLVRIADKPYSKYTRLQQTVSKLSSAGDENGAVSGGVGAPRA